MDPPAPIDADRRPNPRDPMKSATARPGEREGKGGIGATTMMMMGASSQPREGDAREKGKEKARMDVFVERRSEVERSPSFELIEETPRAFVVSP